MLFSNPELGRMLAIKKTHARTRAGDTLGGGGGGGMGRGGVTVQETMSASR